MINDFITKLGLEEYYIIILIAMVIPATVIVYYVLAFVFRTLLFRKPVDLSDVVFSKTRIKQIEKSDMEEERNIVSVQEAIAVSDFHNQRALMMSLIRKDMKKNLGSITYALNSDDSETSHYAAAALRDELNEFRNETHRLYQIIKDAKKLKVDECFELIELINSTITQDVFKKSEQSSYVWMMEEILKLMYREDYKQIKPVYYEWIVNQLMKIGFEQEARQWCEYAMSKLPDELSSYKCYLRLYYGLDDGESFMNTMKKLKSTNIKIDQDTLELMRMFN